MIRCLIDSIKYVDQFGVPFQPYVQNDSKYYKSFLSGILTIIIYGLSLCYIIIQIQSWKNGDILPKVQQLSVSHNNLDESIEFSPFILNIQYTGDEKYFQNKQLFDVKVSQYRDNEGEVPVEQIQTQNCNNKLNQTIFSTCLKNNNNYNLSVNYDDSYQNQNLLLITFYKCNSQGIYEYQQQHIFIDKNCINDTELDYIMTQGQLWIALVLQKKQFNIISQQTEIFQEVQYIPFDNNFYQIYNLNLIQQQISIDNGILFDYYQQKLIINDYKMTNSYIRIKNSQYLTLSTQEAFIQLSLFLSSEQNQLKLQRIKLGEFLASISSIFGALMCLRYLGFSVNEYLLQHQIEEKILQAYLKKNYQQKSIFQRLRQKFLLCIDQNKKLETSKLIKDQLAIYKILEQLSCVDVQTRGRKHKKVQTIIIDPNDQEAHKRNLIFSQFNQDQILSPKLQEQLIVLDSPDPSLIKIDHNQSISKKLKQLPQENQKFQEIPQYLSQKFNKYENSNNQSIKQDAEINRNIYEV